MLILWTKCRINRKRQIYEINRLRFPIRNRRELRRGTLPQNRICEKNRKLRIKQLWHGLYIGALYAGGVLGMKKTFAKLSQRQKKIIIITAVGLAEPTHTAHR